MADVPLVGPGSELQLTIDGEAVLHEQVLEEQDALARVRAREDVDAELGEVGEELLEVSVELELVDPAAAPVSPAAENLYALGERLAARAASPATRRQYGSIYRSFGDWLRGELGRPPLSSDLDADVIAAYARHLELRGGRGGGPAAPATRRVYLQMIRALARHAGYDDVADEVRVPGHTVGPPETLTDSDYANLLRVPDRRSVIGRRDYALLRSLGDMGLRSAELRGMRMGDIRRPRANALSHRLLVRGKGGRERELQIPDETQLALDAWLAVHPLARGRGLADHEPMFVRLGRRRGAEEPEPLSAQSVYKLVQTSGGRAGIPGRLCHPHALRSYWATGLLEDGMPTHIVQEQLGHADLRTTGRYAAVRPSAPGDVAEVMNRRHQEQRRRRA